MMVECSSYLESRSLVGRYDPIVAHPSSLKAIDYRTEYPVTNEIYRNKDFRLQVITGWWDMGCTIPTR